MTTSNYGFMTFGVVALNQKFVICLVHILEISELHYLNHVNQL